ncbi:MAG: hypothetical protein OWU32_10070 [Firmicutes bacterium]|nr:hypothetical protein [Bacillota bacterium]
MWEVTDSFTKLMYPFHMRLHKGATLSTLAQSLTAELPVNAASDMSRTSAALWIESPVQRHELDNLLPYVKQYMQNTDHYRRFTLREPLLASLDNLQTTRMSRDDPGFRIAAIDVHLFFNNIGFVTIEIQPSLINEEAITMPWLEDVNADLSSLSQGKPILRRSVTGNPTPLDDKAYVDLLEGGGMTTGKMIVNLLAPLCRQIDGSFQCVEPMVDTFMPVYGGVLLTPNDETEAADPDGVTTGADASQTHRDIEDAFQDFVVRHGIVLRKTLPSSNRNRFSRQLLSDPLHNYMPYHNVVHTQSLEGGFVVAYDNRVGHYFHGRRSGAMQSFRTNYFTMMLLALHQRMSILSYASEAGLASPHEGRAAMLRTLREQIYDFTSRCYFSQASFSEERDQLYRRWQHAFNVGQMYGELKEQVHDIDEYLAQAARDEELSARQLEVRQEASRNRLIGLITLVLLPISIGSSVIQASPIMANWLHSGHPLLDALLIAVATLVMTGLITLWLLVRRRSWD